MNPCRICHSTRAARADVATERMFGMGGTFVYNECASCESLSLRTVPNDLSEYYPPTYYSYGTWPLVFRRRIALQTLLFRKGGRRLAAFVPGRHRASLSRPPSRRPGSRRRWRRRSARRRAPVGGSRAIPVVDPYATADRTALGSPIVHDELTSVTGTFDVVMFHHSLEHLDDPGAALRATRPLLDRDGVLVVRTPTVSSACWRRYGVEWVELDAPRHLAFPSESGLKAMLGDAGFRVEQSWRDGESFQLWGSELYRRGLPYAGADPKRYFSARQLRSFERETRRLNRIGEGGRIAVLARVA